MSDQTYDEAALLPQALRDERWQGYVFDELDVLLAGRRFMAEAVRLRAENVILRVKPEREQE